MLGVSSGSLHGDAAVVRAGRRVATPYRMVAGSALRGRVPTGAVTAEPRQFEPIPRSLSGFAPTGSSLFCVFLTRANNIGSEFQYFARLGARRTIALGPCRKLGLIQWFCAVGRGWHPFSDRLLARRTAQGVAPARSCSPRHKTTPHPLQRGRPQPLGVALRRLAAQDRVRMSGRPSCSATVGRRREGAGREVTAKVRKSNSLC